MNSYIAQCNSFSGNSSCCPCELNVDKYRTKNCSKLQGERTTVPLWQEKSLVFSACYKRGVINQVPPVPLFLGLFSLQNNNLCEMGERGTVLRGERELKSCKPIQYYAHIIGNFYYIVPPALVPLFLITYCFYYIFLLNLGEPTGELLPLRGTYCKQL